MPLGRPAAMVVEGLEGEGVRADGNGELYARFRLASMGRSRLGAAGRGVFGRSGNAHACMFCFAQVIMGWDYGLEGMKVGGERELVRTSLLPDRREPTLPTGCAGRLSRHGSGTGQMQWARSLRIRHCFSRSTCCKSTHDSDDRASRSVALRHIHGGKSGLSGLSVESAAVFHGQHSIRTSGPTCESQRDSLCY